MEDRFKQYSKFSCLHLELKVKNPLFIERCIKNIFDHKFIKKYEYGFKI
jgi:hypothetical protein